MKIYASTLLRRIQGTRVPMKSLYENINNNSINIFTCGDYDCLSISEIDSFEKLKKFYDIDSEDKEEAKNRIHFDRRISILTWKKKFQGRENPYFVDNLKSIKEEYPLICYLELRLSDLICKVSQLWDGVESFLDQKVQEVKCNIKYDIFKCLGSDDIIVLIYGTSYETFFQICDILREQRFLDLFSIDSAKIDASLKKDETLKKYQKNHILKNTYSIFGFIWDSSFERLPQNRITSLEPIILFSLYPGHDYDDCIEKLFNISLEKKDTKNSIALSRKEITGIFDVSIMDTISQAELNEAEIIIKTKKFFENLMEFDEEMDRKRDGSPILWTNTIWSRKLEEKKIGPPDHNNFFDYSQRIISHNIIKELRGKLPGDIFFAFDSCIRSLNCYASNPLQSRYVLDILYFFKQLIKKINDDDLWKMLEEFIYDEEVIYKHFESLYALISNCLLNRMGYATHTLKPEMAPFLGCSAVKVLLGYSGIYRATLNSIKDIKHKNFKINFICILANAKSMVSLSYFGKTGHAFIINQIPTKNLFDFESIYDLLHELFHHIKFSKKILNRKKRIEVYAKVLFSILIEELIKIILSKKEIALENEKEEIKEKFRKKFKQLEEKFLQEIYPSIFPCEFDSTTQNNKFDQYVDMNPAQQIFKDFAEIMNQCMFTEKLINFLPVFIEKHSKNEEDVQIIKYLNEVSESMEKIKELFVHIRRIPQLLWTDFDEVLADVGLISLIEAPNYLPYILKKIKEDLESISLESIEREKRLRIYLRKYNLLKRILKEDLSTEEKTILDKAIKSISSLEQKACKDISVKYLYDALHENALWHIELYDPIVLFLSEFFDKIKNIHNSSLANLAKLINSGSNKEILTKILSFSYKEVELLSLGIDGNYDIDELMERKFNYEI